jgi:hypothetical protein
MLLILFVSATFFFGKQILQYVCLIEKKEGLRTRLSMLWLWVPSIGFGGAGIIAFKTGNLTLFLHFLVLGVFFMVMKNPTDKKIFIFQSIILSAAMVKPYFLAYLTLLIYLTDYKKFTLVTLTTVSLTTIIWLSASIFAPNLYEQFVISLTHQTLGKGDLGYAVFGLVRRHTGDSIGIILHTIVMLVALMGLVIFIKRKGYDLRSEKTIPLAIFFIIFINPRMKEYDFFIAIFFSYMFLFLENQSTYLKAVCFSWGIATVPLLASKATELDLIGPIKILNEQNYFQILGFLVLTAFLMLSTNSKTHHELISK